MADAAQLQALLRSFPFLSDQPDELLALLASRAQLIRYAFGQPIARPDRAQIQTCGNNCLTHIGASSRHQAW